MITGYRPSSYFETYDKKGNKITGEGRSCSHCQYSWVYVPDSEPMDSPYIQVLPPWERPRKKRKQRGFCLHCRGLLCGRKQCMKSCAPFSELTINEDKKYKLTEEGVYVKS